MLLCTLGCIRLHIKILYTKILQTISRGISHCCFFFFNGLVINIIKVLFVGHVFQSGIFVHLKFVEYPYILFLRFFVGVTFFTIYHVDIIISKGYPGWLFLVDMWAIHRVGHSFVWEDSPDFHLMGLCRYCCCIHGYVGRTSLRCVVVSLSHCVFYIFLCMLRGPFIIRWSLCIVSDVYYLIICFGFQLF